MTIEGQGEKDFRQRPSGPQRLDNDLLGVLPDGECGAGGDRDGGDGVGVGVGFGADTGTIRNWRIGVTI